MSEQRTYRFEDARGILGPADTRGTLEARRGPPIYEDDEYAVYAPEDERGDATVIQKGGMGYGCPCIPGRGSYHEGINRMVRSIAQDRGTSHGRAEE